jgi:hypothetical protein
MERMRRINDDERRNRLGRRHQLAPTHAARDVVELAHTLVGLHATDPISPFLSARARTAGFETVHLERHLYDDRTLIRMLGMRRTVFVIPTDLAATVHQACTAKIATTNRRRLVKLIQANSIADDGDTWLKAVEDDVVATLERLGDASAIELSDHVPLLRTKVAMAPGKSYGADVAINNQVLTQLGAQGRIVRGRPAGPWSSTRYRWASIRSWTDRPLDQLDQIDAETRLARRWMATFGPATEADLKWWAGWTLAQTRRALASIEAVQVELDHATGWVLPDDIDPVAAPDPWIAFLPALDPTPMGWIDRDWYLGKHQAQLFDRTGNIGPTIWANGRIIGGWAQLPTGTIATHLFEDTGNDTEQEVEEQARAIETWLGERRYKSRFATPLERRLIDAHA